MLSCNDYNWKENTEKYILYLHLEWKLYIFIEIQIFVETKQKIDKLMSENTNFKNYLLL